MKIADIYISQKVDGANLIYSFYKNNRPISMKCGLELSSSAAFCKIIYKILLDCATTMNYIRLAFPCFCKDNISTIKFTFVVTPFGALRRMTVDKTFFQYFTKGSVAVFSNRAGTVRLICPTAGRALNNFIHLASFVKTRPVHFRQLWTAVAAEALRLSKTQNVWLSTHGTGIGWLHFRIDKIPRYYWYDPFKAAKRSV
jgi:hypothetical protein